MEIYTTNRFPKSFSIYMEYSFIAALSGRKVVNAEKISNDAFILLRQLEQGIAFTKQKKTKKKRFHTIPLEITSASKTYAGQQSKTVLNFRHLSTRAIH